MRDDGMLVFTKIRERGLDGVQIESHDMGPGIADVNQALGDGFSSAGGLGYGLGTINRFMDELEINSRRGPEAGTHIICKRWIRKRGVSLVPCPLSFGAATRLSSYHEGERGHFRHRKAGSVRSHRGNRWARAWPVRSSSRAGSEPVCGKPFRGICCIHFSRCGESMPWH